MNLSLFSEGDAEHYFCTRNFQKKTRTVVLKLNQNCYALEPVQYRAARSLQTQCRLIPTSVFPRVLAHSRWEPHRRQRSQLQGHHWSPLSWVGWSLESAGGSSVPSLRKQGKAQACPKTPGAASTKLNLHVFLLFPEDISVSKSRSKWMKKGSGF